MVKTRSQSKENFKEVSLQTKTSPVRRQAKKKTSSNNTIVRSAFIFGMYASLACYLTKDMWGPYAHSHFTLV